MPRVILPEFLKVIMSIQTAQLTEKLQLAMVHFTSILRLSQKQARVATISVMDLKANVKSEANLEITRALQRVSETHVQARPSDDNFEDACMSHQRLQALDGFGYRACYMDKLRQVARESDCDESNRDHWFGKNGAHQLDEQTHTQAEQSESKTRAKRQNPRLLNNANITSCRLNAYIESLPKEPE